MEENSIKKIKKLFRENQLNPSKKMGQNFLIDKNALKKIIEAGNIQPDETIIEIGPGTGILTFKIAELAKKVIAIEKDEKISEILKKESKRKNIKIINKDALVVYQKIAESLKDENFKLIANIPYYITSQLIRKILESDPQPEEIVLTIQKEVAQRICSSPPKMNLLAISVLFYAKPKIVSYISKKSFWPSPKVDSAIIKIIPKKNNQFIRDKNFQKKFFQVVRAGFSQPRKQLLNNLAKELKLTKEAVSLILIKNKINPTQRAETLSLEQWIKLTTLLT